MGGNGGAVDPWIATVNVDLDEETKDALGQTFTQIAPKSDVKTYFNSLIANLLVDSEMVANLGKLFQIIDTNKSGSVDKEEFRKFMESRNEESKDGVDGNFVNAIFENMDTDSSGKIEFSEFITAGLERSLIESNQNLESVFNTLCN